jgi:hypothetical protein
MHDTLVVAHEIIRPWPARSGLAATGSRGDGVRWRMRLNHQHTTVCLAEDGPHRAGPFPWWKPGSYSRFWRLAGRDFYWPPLVTIWHREPRGHDSGEVCPHTRRVFNEAKHEWRWVPASGWRWHVWHWRIQVHPYQRWRRRLLTRCAWCGGRDRRNDPVNISHSFDGERSRWWRGECGLYHRDCSSVEQAHRTCRCGAPLLEPGQNHGRCLVCGLVRPYGFTPGEADQLLAALRPGSRIPAVMRPGLEAAWAEQRAARETSDG